MPSKAEAIWEPISLRQFDGPAMRHLLRRIAFTATFETVEKIKGKEPAEAVKILLDTGTPYPIPDSVKNFRAVKGVAEENHAAARAEMREFNKKYGNDRAMMKPGNRAEYNKLQAAERAAQMEVENYLELVFADYAQDWIAFAADHENSVQEKLTMFLANVLVVNRTDGMKDYPPTMHQYQDALRRNRLTSYPKLVKGISTNPGMMNMLDLPDNTAGNPNENYARELMELFTMGEGNGYTEEDIKEAARALTGYRYDGNYKFNFNKSDWDSSEKTVLGQTGNFTGQDIVDIIFKTPEAQTYLPRKMVEYFMTPEGIPEPYVEALGKQWAENEFSLEWLFTTFFSSKAFFTPTFRGNMIKSPIQLYVGLMQDLRLDVSPFPRRVTQMLDLMGQRFLDPPDVEGWTGGEEWITNSTVQIRRTLIESHFIPVDKRVLTAVEKKQFYKAEQKNKANLFVSLDRIGNIKELSNDEIIDRMLEYFLPIPVDGQFRSAVMVHMAMGGVGKAPKEERMRQSIMAILQSPYYQLH